MKLPQQKKLSRKWVIIGAALFVIILAAGGGYYYTQHRHTASQEGLATRPINSVNYDSPTSNEIAAGTEQKEKNKEREKLDNTPATNKADIVVTDASQYTDGIEVRAYLPNVYEDGGTCTATFTMANQSSVTVAKTGFKDAKTTQCGALDIPRSSFNATGNWSLVVTYNSNTAQGTSAAQEVTIK